MSRLFPDSKHFVDMSISSSSSVNMMRDEWLVVEKEELDNESLMQFVERHFLPPGSEMEEVFLHGGSSEEGASGSEPSHIGKMEEKVRALWLTLTRHIPSPHDASTSSLIPLPQPFVIPGDRFREVYYWDSYWIILGLLTSEGDRSRRLALGMCENLLSLVERFGFVPNGTRTYYLNRSQPPLLSSMVSACVSACGTGAGGSLNEVGRNLLSRALPCLIQTWTYWNSGMKSVTVKKLGGSVIHTLSRYYADWDKPRPESYREDFALAEKMYPAGGASSDEAARRALYRDIASAAESGWDFSSRWFGFEDGGLESIRTTRVIPSDLNALLYRTALDISKWAGLLGDLEISAAFLQHAQDRHKAMIDLMWDDHDGCFHDLHILSEGNGDEGNGVEQIKRSYASNFVPLWAGCCEGRESDVIRGLKSSGLIQPAGIDTSRYKSGEQWDSPNAWPPLQHLIVEGLMHSGIGEGVDLAKEIAKRWLETNSLAFEHTGFMHEKYNALRPGEGGGGGEYEPQVGFGWANGVFLLFLRMFPVLKPNFEP